MNEALLALKDIDKSYGQGETAIRILAGASLSVSSGEIVALVAPSGAGKSTLLHICGLLERPDAGEVDICGTEAARLTDRQRTLMRRLAIGYVYQFHHLLPEFNATENVAMPQLIAGVPTREATARALDLLALMGLKKRATHRPAELSGGEQQRVAIARAAANRPRLMLADEPTGNLDPATSEAVFLALSDLVRQRGAACIIATHNHDLARRADRIVTISDGKLIPLSL